MRKTADIAAPRQARHPAAARPPDGAAVIDGGGPVLRDDLVHHVSSASIASVDHLKFRIVTRRGRHYFKDVRFKGPLTLETIHVVKFFEGRCLESLTAATLHVQFATLPALSQLEKLVRDLRQVLID